MELDNPEFDALEHPVRIAPYLTDIDGTRYSPGAFDVSVAERGHKLAVTDEHRRPLVGVASFTSRQDGLYAVLDGPLPPRTELSIRAKPIRHDDDGRCIEASLRQIVATRLRTNQSEAAATLAAIRAQGGATS